MNFPIFWVVLIISSIAVLIFPKQVDNATQAVRFGIEFIFLPLAGFLLYLGVTANMLTGGRILFTVLMAGANVWWLVNYDDWLPLEWMILTGGVLALTDILDGLMARHAKDASSLGKILDPIADKVFGIVYSIRYIKFPVVGRCLFVIYFLYIVSGAVLLATSLYRKSPSDEKLADKFEANSFGQAKTFMQFAALIILYYNELTTQHYGRLMSYPAVSLLLISLPLEIKSMSKKGRELWGYYKRKRTLSIVGADKIGA